MYTNQQTNEILASLEDLDSDFFNEKLEIQLLADEEIDNDQNMTEDQKVEAKRKKRVDLEKKRKEDDLKRQKDAEDAKKKSKGGKKKATDGELFFFIYFF